MNRGELRTSETQWRRTRRAIERNRPPLVASALTHVGEWIADNFVLVCLIVLGSAYLAGCMTGRLL